MTKMVLWVIPDAENEREYFIHDATVVPPVGATMDTLAGIRQVYKLHYDYAIKGEHRGDCKVHVHVQEVKSE